MKWTPKGPIRQTHPHGTEPKIFTAEPGDGGQGDQRRPAGGEASDAIHDLAVPSRPVPEVSVLVGLVVICFQQVLDLLREGASLEEPRKKRGNGAVAG